MHSPSEGRVYLVRHVRHPVRLAYPGPHGGQFVCHLVINAVYCLGGETYVLGYSDTLHGVRTFRLRRIQSITDLANGRFYRHPERFIRDLAGGRRGHPRAPATP